MITLPMLPTPRPVDPHWKCQQSGDCCTIPPEVAMTREEYHVVLKAAPVGIKTEWRDLGDGKVAMKAGPCPFFVFKSCLIYESRPYVCRRFGCMRPDPKTEPFEAGGPLGCKNLSDRVATSRVALRLGKLIQRRSQRWAVRHGWKV